MFREEPYARFGNLKTTPSYLRLAQNDSLNHLAKICIIFECSQKVEHRLNHLTREIDTLFGEVEGKWRLRKRVLSLMRALQPPNSVDRGTYEQYAHAFEQALRMLINNSILKEAEATLPGGRTRKSYCLTKLGLEILGNYKEDLKKIEDVTHG